MAENKKANDAGNPTLMGNQNAIQVPIPHATTRVSMVIQPRVKYQLQPSDKGAFASDVTKVVAEDAAKAQKGVSG